MNVRRVRVNVTEPVRPAHRAGPQCAKRQAFEVLSGRRNLPQIGLIGPVSVALFTIGGLADRRRHGSRSLCLLCATLLAIPSFAHADDSIPSLQRMLTLAGWDEAALAGFSDDALPDVEETAKLLKLLRRMRAFDERSVEHWGETDVAKEKVAQNPVAYRGRLLRLNGRVMSVAKHELTTDEGARLELPAYFLCEVKLDESTVATVLTGTVPNAWQDAETLDEPTSFAGLFIKRVSTTANGTDLFFIARRMAWHPVAVTGLNHSFGRAVLGNLGFDMGLLDVIQNRRRIASQEHEAFYQLLESVTRVSASQLIRSATIDLPNVIERWQSELSAGGQRTLLAQVVVSRAEEGQYSVAPLFNDADRQIGNLAVLEGVARRAVRIEVSRSQGARPNNVVRRFGIDHYFELDVFTDDSQDYPVVFCVPDLPDGFPVGPDLHEPVRMAGFFFKSWLHHVRKSSASEAGGSQQQLAPLLIGPSPQWLRSELATASPLPSIIGGGLFIAALAGIWLAAWWCGRGDREFRRRVIAREYSLPKGISLNEVISDNG